MDLQALTTNRLGSGGKQSLFSQTRSVSESSLWSVNRGSGVPDPTQKGGVMGVAGGLHGGAAKGGRRDLTIETNPKKDFKDDIIDDLNRDLQKLQKCVTCVICQDMLFEPFSLQCGHVFCYTCMVDWLGLYKKRTCPECRAVVKTQPAPAYLIRDMIETFVHRAELTSPHGTGSELRKQQREALAAIEKDRATEGKENGGLFKGMFKKKKLHARRGFRDPADGITRCPDCNWEVEDGLCTGCGAGVLEPRSNVFSDSDEDESDESDDDSNDTESDSDGPDWHYFGRDQEIELEDEHDEDDDEEGDEDDEEEDEDDEEADEWQDEEDTPGYNIDSPGRNPGFSGPHGTSQPRALFHRILQSGSSRNIPTSQNASQGPRRTNGFSVFPSSEAEEGGRSDDTEGSLADFVEHDTPENRRRLQPGNTRNGGNSTIQQITIDSSPIVISSTPATSSNVPPRRRRRNVVLEDEDENDSSLSGASPSHVGLRSINDFPTWPEDDVQQFGYSPLGEVTTASENDDDALSSPPSRRLRRGGPPSSGGGGSVPSVPEEDEESGSGRFGDDDDSEDEDGDVVMTGTRSRAGRSAGGTNGQRRTQNRGGNRTRPVEVQDSDSDSDVLPRPARRNGRSSASSSNRQTHGRNATGNNRSTNSRGRFNPNLQNIFSAHHQQREQTQYDALARYGVSPARSVTPVQRQHTGESRRASTPLRSVEQSNPPVSPLIRLSNDLPIPAFVPGHPPSLLPLRSPMQSPVQNPRQGRAGGPGPPAEHQIVNNSRPILSNPPSDMQQAPRAGTITIPSPGLRVRGRNSRQQLRGTSSRVGLRAGSITPTQSQTTSNLAARRQNTVSIERDAIFARGAAIRRQQAPRDPAGTQLGRRNSRISLNPNTNQSQNQTQNQPTAAEASRVTSRSGQQVGSASGRIGVPIANGPVSQSSGGPLWALGGDDGC